MFIKRTLKVFLIAIVVFTIASVTYAYAAANIVPTTKAGDGNEVISGYTISAVHYILNSNPTIIDSVTFTLNSTPVAGSTIKIKLVAGGSTWYTCSNSGTAAVTCNNVSASASTADTLQVVVSD